METRQPDGYEARYSAIFQLVTFFSSTSLHDVPKPASGRTYSPSYHFQLLSLSSEVRSTVAVNDVKATRAMLSAEIAVTGICDREHSQSQKRGNQ